MSDVKFKINDRVRWGTAEGVVRQSNSYGVTVEYASRLCQFFPDGSYTADLPGQPLLELIERPKKTRKVRLWRWECKPFYHANDGWTVRQTTSWREVGPAPDWSKIPGSEREIEVPDEN